MGAHNFVLILTSTKTTRLLAFLLHVLLVGSIQFGTDKLWLVFKPQPRICLKKNTSPRPSVVAQEQVHGDET
jgi:hypothetical protein